MAKASLCGEAGIDSVCKKISTIAFSPDTEGLETAPLQRLLQMR